MSKSEISHGIQLYEFSIILSNAALAPQPSASWPLWVESALKAYDNVIEPKRRNKSFLLPIAHK